MESLIFAINAVMPIVLVVALGYGLIKWGLMLAEFSAKANALVFRVCLPAMLFLNVYEIESIGSVDFGYVFYTLAVVLAVFFINIPMVKKICHNAKGCGALLQATFRSNFALVGIPLAESLYGSEGVAVAALLSAVTIPLFNVLGVISLSIFTKNGKKPSVKRILHGIVTNPLIISIFAGCVALLVRELFKGVGIGFRLSDVTPLYKALGYLSATATPLSLLVLGAQFEFSAVASLKREIIYGTLVRTVIIPVLAIGGACLFFRDSFDGAQFASFVAVFATPVAVSTVPMAQEMGGDTVLAGQLVVFTTVASAFSVGLVSFFLKFIGVLG